MTTTTDLEQCAQTLMRLLPPGHQLVHGSKDGWTVRRWDSYFDNSQGRPRMGWCPVSSDRSLAALLQRLGEPK